MMAGTIPPQVDRTPPGGLLDRIGSPLDLAGLLPAELRALAEEIRQFLIGSVCANGGHLGPNLGVVELTIALHRAFESPRDRILWDTGHQAYVHKILTGRAAGFATLRRRGGLSGYPSRAESPHDLIENSHASGVLCWADGLARADQLRGERDRRVVAVIGDGAMCGGMAWEALNNLAAAQDRPVVVVLNDNQRSYSPTIGGLANHLADLRAIGSVPGVLTPENLFESLGLIYLGPVDGHDIPQVEAALRQAAALRRPVLVHVLTEKGRGYQHAEGDDVHKMHAVPVTHAGTGRPAAAARPDWTGVFAEEMVRIGADRPDVVGITAAMPNPVGLDRFGAAYPDRLFDVGIAEQHAVASAAGLAAGGMHPVVAIYSTFLNRAFDQVLLDVAMHRAPVTFVLDRAGITGDDGASHNGMWDLPILQVVPGLRIAAPRDGGQLRAQLREAVAVEDGPTALRFPKGALGRDVPAVGRAGGADVLRLSSSRDVLIVSVGAMAETCLEVADRLARLGLGATVVDPRWVKPLDPVLVDLAAGHRLVVTVEDCARAGGVGAVLAHALQDADILVPLRSFGIPERFLAHGTRAEILAELGLTPAPICAEIMRTVGRLDDNVTEGNVTELFPVEEPLERFIA
jgi:1-deoxy-D-xylulose-5-phosphate synthase